MWHTRRDGRQQRSSTALTPRPLHNPAGHNKASRAPLLPLVHTPAFVLPIRETQLEKERVAELGAKRTAELEANAPAPGGGTEGGARRGGMMSGLEVLWQCVQDDSPGDAR